MELGSFGGEAVGGEGVGKLGYCAVMIWSVIEGRGEFAVLVSEVGYESILSALRLKYTKVFKND